MRRLMMVMCLIALSACSPINQPQAAPVSATTAALPAPTADAHGKAGQPAENGGVALTVITATLTSQIDQATPVSAAMATLPAPAADAHGKVGQPAENGGVALTIITATLTSQIDQATPAGTGEAYLIADVLLENTGSDKVSYDVIFFSVLDANDVEYISSRAAPAPALKSGDLMPGDKVRGNVAFKMKAAATGLTIKYQPVVMGHSPRIYIAVP